MAGKVEGMVFGGWVSGTDFSASGGQHRFVKPSTTADMTIVRAGAGERAAGVLLNKPGSGEGAEVQIDGISKVEAGAAIVRGASVMSDANGQAVLATSGNAIQGIALRSVSNANEILEVLLVRNGDE